MKNLLLVIGILLAFSACIFGQETDIRFDQPVDPDVYILQPGDELLVNFLHAELDSLLLHVNSEGFIINQKIGRFMVAGQSLATARNKLMTALKAVYTVTDITVSIKEPRNTSYVIKGEVRKPGAYTISNAKRVSDLITLAGGLTKEASSRTITLWAGDKEYPVDLDRMMYLGDRTANPALYAGLTVEVPSRIHKVVQIVGEVNVPRSVELLPNDDLSLLLTLAGGIRDTGDPENVKIIRGNKTITDVSIQAGDIILVPPRNGKVQSNDVTLFGGINNPGLYPWQKQLNIGALLDEAGGVEADANISLLTVFRKPRRDYEGRISTERFPISYHDLPNEQIRQVVLKPGDSIFIPLKVGYVKLHGEIANPGFVPYDTDQPVSFYLERAGGITPQGDPDAIRMFNPVSNLTILVTGETKVPDGCELIVEKREELK